MSAIHHVALVGLGNMGEPMLANLAKAGLHVKVFDIDTDRAARVAQAHGAQACADWRTLAEGTQVVVTMLPTGAIVRDVLLEAQGGLAALLARGTTVIDMSSSEPTGSQALAEALAPRGLRFIDAPVSGGVPGAVAGTLTIMAGAADPAQIDAVMPVFEALGKRVFRTGGPGSGHAMKALNNFVAAAAYTATAEALQIGARFGLDEALMVDILNVSTGRSFNSEIVFAPHVVTQRFATGFALGLLAKDVGIAAGLGEHLAVDAPVSRLVHQRWQQARAALGDGVDQSRALLAWRSARPQD
ncbi:NAD(P)-dependent oxidoreductase [Xenophilus aerolatus]|nr:NAD(P)-dependent oxidoreductase [Xenophilus aerolatus]